MNQKFQPGDKVRKISGYPFVGTVVSVHPDDPKCCVRHADGWEHIFSDTQLALDHPEYQYLDLLNECRTKGVYREGRNGGTYGLFGRQIRFDLSKGFPLLTTKKVHWKSVVVELLWFLRGDTNVKYLHDHGVTIWDEWADLYGDLGPVYGAQWRSWPVDVHYNSAEGGYVAENYVDQIQNLIDGLRTDPHGRRHIVTAWNPAQIDDMALPPCHCLFQFFVSDGKLSCQLYQRSADVFLGVPFNIASYALLTHLVAREVGLEVGEFVHTFGDVHLYANHVEQAIEQCSRRPVPFPTLRFDTCDDNKSILDGSYQWEDLKLVDYNPHPAIKAEVSK